MARPKRFERPDQAALFSLLLLVPAALVVAAAKSYLFPDFDGILGLALLGFLIVTVVGFTLVRFVVWPLANQASATTVEPADVFLNKLQTLDSQLSKATTEAEVINIWQANLANLTTPGLVELHVIGELDATLHLVAANAENPIQPEPSSAWEPLAANAGTTLTFPNTSADDVCPHLAKRLGAPCSAVSIPLVAQHGILGVLHATGPVDLPPTPTAIAILEALASRVAFHIALQRSAVEAWRPHTDPATSLPSVFDAEREITRLVAGGGPVVAGLINIENFAQYTADNGTPIANTACRWLAVLLLGSFAPGTVLGTDGSGEFLLGEACPDVHTGRANMLARIERIQAEVAQGRGPIKPMTLEVNIVDES